MKIQTRYMSIVLLLLAAAMPFGNDSVNTTGTASAMEPFDSNPEEASAISWSDGNGDNHHVSGTVKNIAPVNRTATWVYEKKINQGILFPVQNTNGFDYGNWSISKGTGFDYGSISTGIDTQVTGVQTTEKPTEPIVTRTIVFADGGNDDANVETINMNLEDAMSFDPERSVRVIDGVAHIGGIANNVEFPSKVLPDDVLPS